MAEKTILLQLDPAVHELLRWPLRELYVTLPVRLVFSFTPCYD
jgi:glutamate dehydrogenase (NAD(P)+)